MPIFLECDRCTACCRWPGQVRLAPGEVERIAEHLGITADAFIQQHTRLTHQRDGLALLDKSDGTCQWLAGHECRIQAVKPQQCRDFPNLWRSPETMEKCQAKPVEVTPGEWITRVRAATGRPVSSWAAAMQALPDEAKPSLRPSAG